MLAAAAISGGRRLGSHSRWPIRFLPLLDELAALLLQLLLGIAGGQPGVQLQLDGQAEGTAPTACGLTWLAPGRDVRSSSAGRSWRASPSIGLAVNCWRHLIASKLS